MSYRPIYGVLRKGWVVGEDLARKGIGMGGRWGGHEACHTSMSLYISIKGSCSFLRHHYQYGFLQSFKVAIKLSRIKNEVRH